MELSLKLTLFRALIEFTWIIIKMIILKLRFCRECCLELHATSYVPKYIVVLKAILFFPVAWETPFKKVLEVIREVHNCTHCINVKTAIVAMVKFCCFCTPYHMGINEQIQQEKISKINLIEYHESKIDKMP